MRSSLAGIILAIAYGCATLTISAFMLDHNAFDPGRAGSDAGSVLGDDDLQQYLVNFLVDTTSGAVTTTPQEIEQLRATLYLVTDHPDGQAFLAPLIRDAHGHLIGEIDGPVTVTGEELVPIVRSQGAASIDSITVPVQRNTLLAILNDVLAWVVPIGAIASLALLLVGFVFHRDKASLVRLLAMGLALTGLLLFIVGYIVPRWLLPLADDSVWAHVSARLADHSIPLLVFLEVLLFGAAGALVGGSGMLRRRRRWNQPISTYRYVDDRRWN